MKNCTYLIAILVIISSYAEGQLKLTSFPENLQLFPRDANNLTKVQIAGQLIDQNSKEMKFELYKNDDLIFKKITSLTFSFDIILEAKLCEYAVKLYKRDFNGNDYLVKESNQILCGDLIVLYGQSNIAAIAGVDQFNQNYSDKYMRNFDKPENNQSQAYKWYKAKEPYAQVGTIGNFLMKTLIDSLQIPFGIINGAVGGASITHLKSFNPQNKFDTNYPYGKLLTRIRDSGFQNHIKSFVYYQGEADASIRDQDCNIYPQNFEDFFTNINADVPSIQKFYEIQINMLKGNLVNRAGYLRDFQRKTIDYYSPKVEAISAIGIQPYDGVHFSGEGYIQIANNLSNQILKFQYGGKNYSEIEQPNIKSAFLNSTKDSLTLEFQIGQKMLIENNKNNINIENLFYFSSNDYTYDEFSNKLSNHIVNENFIKFKISYNPDIKFVSYLPSNHQNFNGPQIKNSKGLNAFSFYNVPIQNNFSGPQELIPPDVLNVSGISKSQINLSWDKPLYSFSNYVLEYSKDNKNFLPLATLPSETLNFVHANLKTNTHYYYRIKTCDSTDCSRFSSSTSSTTFENFLQPCEKLFLANNIYNIQRELSNSKIISNKKIKEKKTIFYSSQSIELNPGFEYEAKPQKYFISEIRSCL